MLKKILLLSVAAFAAACTSQSAEAVSGDEAEVNEGASFVFAADGAEALTGSAKAGAPITIDYSLDRLTTCRGDSGGAPGWNIFGYYSENNGPAKSFEVTKIGSAGREKKIAQITPSQGGDLAIWFQVTSVFGCTDYDSDSGANFHVQVQGQAPEALPRISFPADPAKAPTVEGELRAGKKVLVHYDQARLDECAATQGGLPQYSIGGYAKLGNAAPKLFETGRPEAGERVAIDAVVDLPAAGTLALWFETNSVHGCHAFDSNLSQNYTFDVK